MTGRSRFTKEELARMDKYSEMAARLSPDHLAKLCTKYRMDTTHPHRDEILAVLYNELSGR